MTQTRKLKMIVQGDVFLVPCDKIPAGAKKVKKSARGYVLAEGEATGHAHCITGSGIEMYESEGILYLKTNKQVQVKHEEHKPVTVAPGIWEVGRVKEYDAFEEEARNVRD